MNMLKIVLLIIKTNYMVNLKRITGIILASLIVIAIGCNSQPKPTDSDKPAENKDKENF